MDEAVSRATLTNGTRVLFISRPHLHSVFVQIAYAVGSRNERFEEAGVAHFIEHVVFRGTPSRQSQFLITREIERVGGEINAFTSEEATGYHVRVPADRLSLAIDVLSDMMLHPLLRQEDVDSERGPIIEEKRQYMDDPSWTANELMLSHVFPEQRIGQPIIGSLETIGALRAEHLSAFRKAHYVPANALVTVAGAFDQTVAMTLLEHTIGKAAARRPTKRFARAIPETRDPSVHMVHKKSAEQDTFVLGFAADGYGSKRRAAMLVMNTMLSGGMSFRLVETVRTQHGLAYAIDSDWERFRDAGTFSIIAAVTAGKVQESLRVTIDELRRLRSSDLSQEDLSAAISNTVGSAALAHDSLSMTASHQSLHELAGHPLAPLQERLNDISAVTRADIRAAAKALFRPERAHLAAITRYKTEPKPLLREIARLG